MSLLDHQCSHECSSMNMAWPRRVPGPDRPIWCAHWMGVMPCRRTISWNSPAACAQCTVKGSPRSRAAATLSRSRSSVQVSICAGEIMPDSRPLGCLARSSQSRSASSNACRPAASFHSYSSRWERRTTHRDEA